MSKSSDPDDVSAWEVYVDGEERLLIGSPFKTSERILVAPEDMMTDPDALYGPRDGGSEAPPGFMWGDDRPDGDADG